ncbi:UNVERIFIED_CONTAM: hypothetical protein FKN15_007863 [Acipenser sinensis]
MYHEARLQLQAITSAEKQQGPANKQASEKQGLGNKQASEISGLKTELSEAKQKAVDLKKKLDDQIKESVNKQEHFRVVTALETEVKGLRSEVEKMETHLGERKAEASRLQAEVVRAFQEMRSLELQEKHRQEEVKGSLEKDQALGQDLRLVSSKCEDLRQEMARWKQQVVEERERRREMSGRVSALERIVCKKEREAQKLEQTVLMLKTRGEELTQACENKDRKSITGHFAGCHDNRVMVSCVLEDNKFIVSDREAEDIRKTPVLLRSVFPPMLSRGLPRRHHIVTYLLLQSTQSHLQLQDRLCPEPREVSGCVWVDPSLVRAIVSTVDGAEHSGKAPANLPQTVRVTEVCSDGALLTSELPVSVLLNTAPPEGPDVERISTGTKYALELWLKAMETGPDSTSTQQ